MNLFLLPHFPSHSSVSSFTFPSIICSYRPISSSIRRKPNGGTIPARDKIIDFGKYRGKMLGTLPSKYLKWVSKNLRARDFEDWAKLADEVLRDPVYKDRLEWEFAEQILNGDFASFAAKIKSPVSDLLEVSDSFGWDNDDKFRWSKIDFSLLGTSKGGRIPRISVPNEEDEKKKPGFDRDRNMGFMNGGSTVSQISQMGSLKKDLGLKGAKKRNTLNTGSRFSQIEEKFVTSLNQDSNSHKEMKLGFLGKESRFSRTGKVGSLGQRKVGFLSKGFRVSVLQEEEEFENESSGRVKRVERIERQRLKRGLQMHKLKLDIGVKKKVSREDENEIRFQQNQNHDQDQDQTLKMSNPFPGREALLNKVLNNRRVL